MPGRSKEYLALLLAALVQPVSPSESLAHFPVVFVLSWGETGSLPHQFMEPFGIDCDQEGYVYVVENTLHRIQKYDGFGNFVLAWGSLGGGDGQFRNPEGVAVGPDGYVYVADARNRRVQKFTTNGDFVLAWETPNPGPTSDRARDIAFDSNGTVYVTFGEPGRVEKYTPEGVYLEEWDIPGNDVNPAGGALGIAISSSNEVFVADPTHSWSCVRRFDTDGTLQLEWGGTGTGPGEFYVAIDVEIDDQGRVFVTDLLNARVQVFTTGGVHLGQWGSPGDGIFQFRNPRGVSVNPSLYIFVVDGNNDRIQKFGFGPLSLETISWGKVKSLYRMPARPAGGP
jgi:DNA-binding beta-propeller fold protein YncE